MNMNLKSVTVKTMRPYILSETNWKSSKHREIELAVLPWGATEAHNYHLPYGTDNLQVEHIAASAAGIAWEKGAKIIVLPVIPYGVNTGQSDIKLDMNIYPSTQAAILNDICETLNRQGIDKLLILNGHGGNNFKSIIRETGRRFPDMFISVCHWFRSLDKTIYFEHEGDHADEMETSLMLYLKSDWVLPMDEAGAGETKKFKIRELTEDWAWAERRWSEITDDTGSGNPERASAEKGEKYFKDVTEKIAVLFLKLSDSDTTDLYE